MHVDFRSAFDSMWHAGIKLYKCRILSKLTTLLHYMYNSLKSCVKHESCMKATFPLMPLLTFVAIIITLLTSCILKP